MWRDRACPPSDISFLAILLPALVRLRPGGDVTTFRAAFLSAACRSPVSKHDIQQNAQNVTRSAAFCMNISAKKHLVLLGSFVLSYRSNPYNRETRHEFDEFGKDRQNGKGRKVRFCLAGRLTGVPS